MTIQRINYLFGLDWVAVPAMFDVDRGTGNSDLVITCVDVAQFRADLAKSKVYGYSKTLWLDTGNGSHTGQVILGTLGRVDDKDVKLPTVFDFYPELDGMQDNNTPSCSMEEALANQDLPINRAIANVVMQLIWSLLRHGGMSRLQINGKKCDFYPMVRPLPGKIVNAWDESGCYLGTGKAGIGKAGVTIRVGGVSFDSNSRLHWLYADC